MKAKKKPVLRLGDPSRLMATALVAWSWSFTAATANPTGASVAAGQATISQPSATQLSIAVTTPKAIINWSSFSIQKNESVVVNQPGASSVLLNRVNAGGGISYLLGSLTANGQVYLVNPAGIVVGAGAQITAAQLLLSTHGLSDANFLNGTYDFNIAGTPGAAVANHGAITATDGAAILAGEQVRNDGVIVAAFGTVVLAGAKTYTVDFSGDGLLKFAITTPVEQLPPGARALVDNSGKISARGGTVLLTAAAAKGVIANVINSSGIIEATSVAQVNGKIVLSGTGGGTAVSGTLDASGKGAGESGGAVAVLGDSVTLAPGARLDVSGDAGGGTALIGGNFHGAGPERNALATTVAQGATIDADALTSGDGGRVAVWSDGVTHYDGAITARGGAHGGNGGSVETSGGQQLWVGGTVDTSAPAGHVGSWLLDPAADFTICFTLCSTTGSIIASALATSDVVIEANGTNAQVTTSGTTSFGASTGNILVEGSGAIDYNSPHQLSLLATGSITVDAEIQNSGGGAINLVAGWNGTTGLSGSTFTVATVLANSSSFGRSGGDIAIGDGSQGSNIAVGSAGGPTTLAAHTLTLQGSDTTNGADAQIGFHGNGSGAITVALTGDLTLTGGSGNGDGNGAVVQIGNGAADFSIEGDVSGDINVTVAGTTNFAPTLGFDGLAVIGNASVSSTLGTSSGNVVLKSGAITSSDFGLGTSISNDIQGGNVTIDATANGTSLSFGNGDSLVYSSGNALLVEAPSGTINLDGMLINDGSGPITITAAHIIAAGAIATAGGTVSVNGAVTLAGGVSIDTTDFDQFPSGGAIIFGGTIDNATSATPQSLGLTSGAGLISLGTIGATTPIGALAVSGGGVTLAGNVTTDGAVFFTAPTVLAASVTIDSTGRGTTPAGNPVAFIGTVATIDATSPGAQSLTVTAGTDESSVEFDGAIGGTTPLGALTVSGGSILVSGDVTTAGRPVTLTATATDPVIEIQQALSTGAGAVTMTANGTASASINLDPGSSIATTTGAVMLSANSGTNFSAITDEGPISTGTGAVTLRATSTGSSANIYFYNAVATNGGAVTASATADNAAFITLNTDPDFSTVGSISSGAGAVALTATGGDSAWIELQIGSSIATTSGSIMLTTAAGTSFGQIFDEGAISSGTGAVTLNASSTGSNVDIYLYDIATAGGPVTISATGDTDAYVGLEGSITTFAGNIAVTARGGLANGQIGFCCGESITTTSGNVTLAAFGSNSDVFVEGPIQTGSGNVTVASTSTGTDPNPNVSHANLTLAESGSIATQSGSVVLAATSLASDATILLDAIITTQGGPVTLIATGAGDPDIALSGAIETGAGSVRAIAQGTSATSGAQIGFGGTINTSASVAFSATGTYAASVLTDGVITTTGAPISLTASSTTYADVEVGGTFSTGGGAFGASATATDPLNGEAYVDLTGPINTGGGALVLDAANPLGGVLAIDNALALTGAAKFHGAFVNINQAVTVVPGSLAIYDDPLSGAGNIVGTFTELPYDAFYIQTPVPPPCIACFLPPPPTPHTPDILPPPTLPPMTFVPPPITTPLIIDIFTPNGTTPTLVSVVDIDLGGQIFTQIAPTSGNGEKQDQDPVTVLTPVSTAQQPQPKVQVTEAPLGGNGSNIFQARQTFVQHFGVPGIGQPASMGGNRSLWFGRLGGP